MLETQTIDLVFTQGADNKTESKNVRSSKAVVLDNTRYDKIGAAIPRGGFTEHSITSPLASDISPSFGAVGDQTDSLHLSRGSAWRIANSSPILVGSTIRGDVYRKALGNADSRRVSAAASSTLVCTAWSDASQNLIVDISELNGPTVLQRFASIGYNANNLVTLYCNGQFYVITQGTSGGTPKFEMYWMDQTNGLISSTTWTPPTVTGTARWDAATDGSLIYLHYVVNDGLGTSLASYSPASSAIPLITSITTSLTFTTKAKALACLCPDSMVNTAVIISAGEDGGNAKVQFLTSALVTTGSVQTSSQASRRAYRGWLVQTSSTAVSCGFSGVTSTGLSIQHDQFSATSSSVTSASKAVTIDVNEVSQPFYQDNRIYQLTDTSTEPTYGSQAIVDWSISVNSMDPAFILGASKNVGNQEFGTEMTLPKPLKIGTITLIPNCFVGSVESFDPTAPTDDTIVVTGKVIPQNQASLVMVDSSIYRDNMIDRTNQQGLLISGTPRIINSSRQVAGPWPEHSVKLGAGRLDINTAPATTFTGAVSCVFAKVMELPNGQQYRQYSPIFTALLSASAIRYTTTTTDLVVSGTSLGVGVRIEFYKTEENGQIFYLANANCGGTVTDAVSTADLLKGRLADINGNELYPEIPSGARIVSPWKDRIALVTADSGTVIKFNKPVLYPLGTCFAAGLEVDIGVEGGSITGLGEMDSPLYVFKRNRIYYMYGDPAGATGDNGSISTPTIFKDGLGCSSPRSVILTPKGLMFSSDKGFYIIARNQEILPVTAGPYNDRALQVTGSAIDRDQSEVYFSYENGDVWAYNYELDAWYRWTFSSNVRGLSVARGTLSASTDVGYEEYSKVTTVDSRAAGGSNAISSEFRSGWFVMKGIRGFQRAKRLYIEAETLQQCDVTIEIYTDYSTAAAQTVVLSPLNPKLEINIHLEVQKCEAIQFRFRSFQYGIKWIGATLEIGAKNGVDKSAAST